jgi:hypothetical protein
MLVSEITRKKKENYIEGLFLLLPFPHFNRAVPLFVPLIFKNTNYIVKG